jgi:hypothetical protein
MTAVAPRYTVQRYVTVVVKTVLRTPLLHRLLSRWPMLLSFPGRKTVVRGGRVGTP